MQNRDDYLKFYNTVFNPGKHCTKSWGLAAYTEGQLSKQAEIDTLQKRIEDALNMLDAESENSWKLWKETADMYEQGASNAYERAYWILKGND